PERVVRRDYPLHRFRRPVKLLDGPVVLSVLTARGKGTFTWSPKGQSCDLSPNPLSPKVVSPGHPEIIPGDAAIWACPPFGGGTTLRVHLEGYRPDSVRIP
ncbi:MAG: hypothetical protein ACYDCL_07380, partial [Myxococcales bacterium]